MDLTKIAERLRKRALGYPETYEEAPWGDRVVKVRGKIFFFCGVHDGALGMSLKLPRSGREVLKEPFAKPTAYGLGKSGWVSITLPPSKLVPDERVHAWIDESYRALAPKKLIAQLDDEDAKANAKPASEKPASAKTKAGRAKAIKKRVVLVSQDPLRIERARAELGERGVTIDATGDFDGVRKRLGKLDAVIVDLGRLQDEGLELAGEIDQSDFEILLFLVGVRDAVARKRAQSAATSADLFKEPPGDPAVADAIVATLRRY
ncbi:MAG TPA: MmcQ/YjbR family DNA-binding protein [Polyangia bacterium]|nr:MmcQ/YjbR family DNA-binding protein [Polyangia bacterium]